MQEQTFYCQNALCREVHPDNWSWVVYERQLRFCSQPCLSSFLSSFPDFIEKEQWDIWKVHPEVVENREELEKLRLADRIRKAVLKLGIQAENIIIEEHPLAVKIFLEKF